MTSNASLFLFLVFAVLSGFAFLSLFVWVNTPSKERVARDRLNLLKTVAEQPGENARQVLEYLRAEEDRRIQRKEREEQKAYVVGGLTVLATGIGMAVMFVMLSGGYAWTVSVMVILIGLVLVGVGLLPRRKSL